MPPPVVGIHVFLAARQEAGTSPDVQSSVGWAKAATALNFSTARNPPLPTLSALAAT
jgi:hypothetical protein